MQQRAPVMRIRFRNLKTGKVLDKTFSGRGLKMTKALIFKKKFYTVPAMHNCNTFYMTT